MDRPPHGPLRRSPRRIATAVWAAPLWLSLGLAPAAADGPAPAPAPTFTKDVAPILRKHCQGCHRPDQVAPFPLETYAQARKRASDIAAVVQERLMPPWKPEPGVGPKLKNERVLAPAEVAVLAAWAEAGAPEGDPKDLAPAPTFPADGWALGKPDLVLEPAEDFPIPASGPDVYRCFVMPTNLPRDVYVAAIEYRPGNRRIVHHMSTFVDTTGDGRKRDKAEEGPGYHSYSGAGIENYGELGGWAAGNEPMFLPAGVGRMLPRQSDVILQVHYHPTGKPEVDRTRLGIYFARSAIKQTIHWNGAANYDFRLPPGKKAIEVKASWFVPVDVQAMAVAPHMHALGRDVRMSVTYPDGRTQDLIHIPDWDPNWQDTYYFEQPVSLPKGSTVRLVATYDNSDHPRNPHHPPKLITWGHDAEKEMCIGYIGLVKAGQDLTRPGERDDLLEIFVRQIQRNVRREILAGRRR